MRLTNKEKINFLKKIHKTDSCWIWTAFKETNGYGKVFIQGSKRAAHRISYILHRGNIPKGMGYHGTVVMHTCDNRACVNPGHLTLGSQKDNMHDAKIKGRKWYGEYSRINSNRWERVRSLSVISNNHCAL